MKEARTKNQIKVFTLCEIIKENMSTAYPLGVFDDIELLETYKTEVIKNYPKAEFEISEQWLDIEYGKDSLDSSSFNLELNPVFDNDTYIKSVQKNVPKGENKARILAKKEKVAKNNDNVDELVGVKITKRS